MEHCYKTFVSLGNAKQHFTRLLNAVESCKHLLSHPILIQRGNTPFQSQFAEVIDFLDMDIFVKYVQNAQVIICHAGVGSVLHTLKTGKCPIIMPRRNEFKEHINNHQVSFAKQLHEVGKILMINNADELSIALTKYEEMNNSSIPSSTKAQKIIQNKLFELLER